MSDSPRPPRPHPPTGIDHPPPHHKTMVATGCLTAAGVVLCMSIILAPLGILLITVAMTMLGVVTIRRRFFTKTTAPCPYCLVTVTFRGEGIKACPDCCHPVVVVLGKLGLPESLR